jgi:hypothetical protein
MVEGRNDIGGQQGENEQQGNQKNMYELIVSTNTWIQRSDMIFERGYFSESTVPYKSCVFIIVAGAVNGKGQKVYKRTGDISYYNMITDKWAHIGDYVKNLTTPICEIVGKNLYCQTGPLDSSPSFYREID